MKKMKKFLWILLATLSFGALTFGMAACADETKGLQYTLSKDGTYYIVTGYEGEDAELIIPATYKNKPVREIRQYAFDYCDSLTKIVIPNSVTSIGAYAFWDCGSLTEIVIPDSVTSIGDVAFEYCSSLTEIVIPNSVTSIGNYAFAYCDNLTEIVIPNSVASIGDRAFSDCEGLIIYCQAESKPSGWDSNWNNWNRPVVWDCDNNDVATDGYIYTAIDGVRYALKDGVAMVTRQATNICSANIPEKITYKSVEYTVTSIGEYAFRGCRSLTEIVIPNSVTSIGYQAFRDCSSLTQIVIPNSVTSIGWYAFYGCSKLTQIVIPNSVTSIGPEAFYGCSKLTQIVIPNSVTSIDWHVFADCESLTIYCEAESKPSGWDSNWNSDNRPVVWGYKE